MAKPRALAYVPSSASRPLHLAAARAKKGISLEAIAEITKISPRFLRAIEAEDFGTLPGGIFATSYLRQYASASGADADELVGVYLSRYGEPEQQEPRPEANAVRSLFARWLRVPART